jgi:hypothetical protein
MAIIRASPLDECAQEANASTRALLRMKLYAHNVSVWSCTHGRGKPIPLVGAPTRYACVVARLADIAIRIVRDIEARTGYGDRTGLLSKFNRIPANLRNTRSGKTPYDARNHAQSSTCSIALLARVEKQLHAETNADDRQPAIDCRPNFIARRREPFRGSSEGADAGEHENVGGDTIRRLRRVRFDAYANARCGERLRE